MKLMRKLVDDRREYQAVKALGFDPSCTPSAMRRVIAAQGLTPGVSTGCRYAPRHAVALRTPPGDDGAQALDVGFRLRMSPIRQDRIRGDALVEIGLERRRNAMALHVAAARIGIEARERQDAAAADLRSVGAEGAD